MKFIFAFSLGLTAFAPCSASAGQTDGITAAAQPAEANTALAQSIRRGEMLYQFDQAAWHSTDVLMAKAGNPEKLPLKGRIVVPVKEGWQAIYYGQNTSGRFTIFSATWNGTKIIASQFTKGESGAPLSVEANGYADIVEMVMSGQLGTKDLWFCNKARPNFVILPGNGPTEFSLYFMTPQEQLNAFPLGGHHRYDIRNGKVVSKRAFSKSCLAFDKKDDAKGEMRDGVTAGFVASHLMDPTPTEIHVFTAMAAKTILFVTTTQNSKTWLIEAESGGPTIKELNEENWK